MVKVGDVVLFRGGVSNGTQIHPAMVTRVWAQNCVNLLVVPDCGAPYVETSVLRDDSAWHEDPTGGTMKAWQHR